MLWIGITGPIGSGKSTASAILRAKGFNVLDADACVHAILVQGSAAETEIFQTFGESVRAADGSLDRRALGRVVFEDPEKLGRLEKILHPRVRLSVAQEKIRLDSIGTAAAFYDVPLLFEKNMESDFDHVLVISAAEPIRRERAKARLNIADAEFDARSARQMDPSIKEKKATLVIRNDGTRAELAAAIDRALTKLGIPIP